MRLNFYQLLPSAAILAVALQASAVPADPRPIEKVLPDGTTITTYLRGDERHHFTFSSDRLPITLSDDGFYYYMKATDAGALEPSDIKVSAPGKQSAAEKLFIAGADKTQLYEALDKMTSQRSSRKAPSLRKVDSTFPLTGSPKALVILVEYTDRQFITPNAGEEFSNMINQEGYSNYGGTGSVHDWFYDNSLGNFTPDFDVYGPVQLPNKMSYYGGNSWWGGDDQRPEEMAIDACAILDSEVDFSQYDTDGDGYVDNIFIFYAGYGEASGGSSDTVWPHSWDVRYGSSGKNIIFDGVSLGHYACSNEVNTSNVMDGIGTFVHEFSHVLGLPDLYATSYTSAFTPGEWSVLDYGPYNNNSRTPPMYSAYERYDLGWMTPIVLDGPVSVKLDKIATNTACIIKTKKLDEYFLIENRQQEGWDAYIPGHGMLVWHIDYNSSVWNNNTVNNTASHQYVDIEEADGLQSDYNRAGDSFPGTSRITEFTDDTTPNMRSWDGTRQDLPITNIKEEDGFIYFDVAGGNQDVDPVQTLEATDVTPYSFTANWEKSNISSCSYLLSVYTADEADAEVKNYLPGYEEFNAGSKSSAVIEGLECETEYRYTVRVRNNLSGIESELSNEMTVTTLPYSLEYVTPTAYEPEEIGARSFTAVWDPVDEAEGYYVNVYQKELGDEITTECGFDGGVDNLPEGWTSSSLGSYSSAANAGKSAPSLRLYNNGQYVRIPVTKQIVKAFSFWYRGINERNGRKLRVDFTTAERAVTSFDIDASKNDGAHTFSVPADEIPHGVTEISINYITPQSSSVAIDDICLTELDDDVITADPQFADMPAGTETRLKVEGLEPNTEYYYNVHARKGDTRSQVSNEIRFNTNISTAVYELAADGVSIVVDGRKVTVKGVEAGTAVDLYNLEGVLLEKKISDGNAVSFEVAEPGVYVVNGKTVLLN